MPGEPGQVKLNELDLLEFVKSHVAKNEMQQKDDERRC